MTKAIIPGSMDEVIDLEGRILQAIPKARKIVGAVGPQHALWDVIGDAEAILAGKPTAIQGTRLDRPRAIAKALTEKIA